MTFLLFFVTIYSYVIITKVPMTLQQFFWVLRKKLSTMVLAGVIFSVIGFFGCLFFTKPFQARTDFLVVQTNNQSQDFYTQFKSSEYLGNVLGEAIYSEKFIDAVVETGKVNKEFLPFDRKDKLDTWRKMVDVQKNLNLSIIVVTVRGTSERDATRIISGVSQVLIDQNSLFRGGDEKSVEIRTLSGPIIERSPSMMKILEVIVVAFFAGIFVTAFFIVIRIESRYKSLSTNENVPLNEMML